MILKILSPYQQGTGYICHNYVFCIASLNHSSTTSPTGLILLQCCVCQQVAQGTVVCSDCSSGLCVCPVECINASHCDAPALCRMPPHTCTADLRSVHQRIPRLYSHSSLGDCTNSRKQEFVFVDIKTCTTVICYFERNAFICIFITRFSEATL